MDLSLYSTARQNLALGPGVGLHPQCYNYALGIPTCWYLKALKFAFPPMQNLKFALPPTRTPNVSQWNIGWVGSPGVGAGVGRVDFMFAMEYGFQAHIQPETLFVLATQHEERLHKQDEIDAAKMNSNVNLANATIFHHLGWALYWVHKG